uniref:Uncharacterized protein n=1 Tax=Panagrolaimus superbus TaxID=310955 RepID=A0A914Y6S7_9BILA
MKKSKRKTSETSSASSLSLQDHKNLNAMQIARNKLVRRARYFSTSKHYPEVGTVHEGELAEMAPVQQAHFTNLFDEVSFASDTEENVIGKATQVKKPVSSRGNNKIILCAPFRTSSKHYPAFEEPYAGFIYDTKLKPEAPEEDLFKCVNFASSSEQEKEEDDKVTRMQSEERQPQQPRKQMATLYFRRNTKQLEGYPIISEAYIGEISQLLRHPDVETINLFDCVSFASESDDEIPISQSSNARDSSKKGSPDKPKKKQLRLFGKTRRSTSEKELDLTSYPKNEAYSGPLEEFTKVEEFNDENLRKIVTIYHSGYSQPLFRHRFVREKHEGIEEIGEAPADYEILHFTSEETTPMARMPELETLPLRSYAKYPIISFTESPKDMKRKFSKSKIIPESSSESSSQSESEVDIVPSLKPSKKKESEGFLSFFKNRLSSKQHQPRKRTGYEGLVEAFAGSYITTPKSCEIPDQPILEHVLVYHNGNSTQQPIDSGFEDGANASESERAGTFKRTGKLFFDKFKLSRDSGDKTTTEEIDKSESLEPRKVITGYESLNTKPFLGLHSSTLYSAEVEQHPLSSTIDSLPAVYYYEGDATLTPFPTETTEIKISTLERIMKTKKSRKDSNFAYEYLSIEGPIIDTNKKDEMIDLPIGEHVTVYHCGRSDVPTAEVPPEVYVYEKEEPISESLQSLTTETVEPQIEQMEIEQKTTTKHESLQSSYPEYFMYEGPIESLERLPETENQHLNEYVNIYHSGLSTDNAAAKKIVISDIEGKAKQYSFDTTPFEGEIEETLAQKELEHLPLHEHAFTYHPGKSEVEMLEDLEEREIQTRELSLIQRLMAMFKKRELQGYPSISEEYTGPIEEINRSEDIKKI